METIPGRSFSGSACAGAGVAATAHAPKLKVGARQHPLDGISREKIKITDVKVTLLSAEIPPERHWFNARTIVWKSDAVLVQVFTDKGIVGIGEASPYGGPVEMKKFAEEHLNPVLIGQNPFDVEFLACGGVGSRGVEGRRVYDNSGRAVWAGVDAALWDIIGKARNVPVYRLLATDDEPTAVIRLYASGGDEYAWYKRPEALIDEALRVKEAGYTAYKFRLGTDWKASGITVQKYIPLLVKLRQAVGPNFDLMQESNMRLTFEQCLELAPVLEELRFLWFEEPCSAFGEDAIEDHVKIGKAMLHVMIAGGEGLSNRFEFKEWIDRGAYDIVQPDCNYAGVTESWHVARMAHLGRKACCPHNWHGGLTIMANAALVAAIPNRLMLEHNVTYSHLREGLFKDPLVAKRGYMELSNKPGYGVEVIPDIARKFPYIPGPFHRPNPELPM